MTHRRTQAKAFNVFGGLSVLISIFIFISLKISLGCDSVLGFFFFSLEMVSVIFLCFYVSRGLLPVGTFSFVVNRLHFHNYRRLRPPIEITHHEPSALIGTVSFLPLYVHCVFVFGSLTKSSIFLQIRNRSILS